MVAIHQPVLKSTTNAGSRVGGAQNRRSIWSVWFVWSIWLDETNQMNQTTRPSASLSEFRLVRIAFQSGAEVFFDV